VQGSGEREQTLNQILVEMDGFDPQATVIVIGATNRADVLDPALLRPGRFDRHVVVQRPDRLGREKILEVHTRNVPLAADVALLELAAATPGLAGAELRNLVNEAALLAARNDRDEVTDADFRGALERIVLGAARDLVVSPEERLRVAYHEAGHALVSLLLPEADPVQRVTIVPRGSSLGATYQAPSDERHNYSREYLLTRIVGALGGRAAEEIVFGTVTTGAEEDLRQVTALANRMVTLWGMSDEIGPVSLDARPGDRPPSEATARAVDREVRRIGRDCHARAKDLLTRERARLDVLAAALLEHESLDEDEIVDVMSRVIDM
jgi:cell division protease FtsH